MPQDDNLDRDLTVGENLLVHAGDHGLRGAVARERRDELLAFASLESRADATVREVSGGMRQRLLIARALVNRPELVVLDEPTTGLDPKARRGVWEVLAGLREQGVNVPVDDALHGGGRAVGAAARSASASGRTSRR